MIASNAFIRFEVCQVYYYAMCQRVTFLTFKLYGLYKLWNVLRNGFPEHMLRMANRETLIME